ncbi:MAG: hypothetical protein QOJ43_1512 [Gaiellaceae bacterium]|nr:hypothetical protein [Gaiellaceae bacterium]
MMRLRGLFVVAVSAACVLAPAAISAVAGQLDGTVGPGFSINLRNADGTTVTKLDPGTYEIVVHDESVEHNFHLFGPGVNEATQVEETGTVTWTVTFGDGRYTLQCDPHSLQMKRTFISGNPPPEPKPKPPTTLLATVGPKSTISLRDAAGRVIKTVKSGAYSITVRDRSKLHNFHLVGKGVNRKTGKAAVGTFTWNVSLGKGALRFFSDQSPTKVKGSITVA